ncbi:hypothetical protein J2T38_001366 [Neisseria perflava]|uniref:glutathione S-transferase N-terminal domain-containing protein n=1 Tax=Neisseria perflava TaxID=33053 RepID=UPI00209EE8A8|nr:glutathione S-transferase N-terminal domain-containing protein [Neisseria perflava]MCP1772537.1 hypothetical protein [Neisseria perflava]
MKLYLSNTSPYGRLCLTRAYLLGLNDLQLVFTDPWQNPPELEAKNPFSQIPVLETDSGEIIYNSLLICQYWENGRVTSAEGLNLIGYAKALLDNAISAFKLEKKTGESREHFLVKRNLEAIARALPHVPTFAADSREWPQVMLGVCLLTVKLRYPEIFDGHARSDTQTALAAFAQQPFVVQTNPDVLGETLPATIGDIPA